MGPDYFGLMGYVGIDHATTLIGGMDAGMKAAGFAATPLLEDDAAKGFRRDYVNESGWVLQGLGEFTGGRHFHDVDQWVYWAIFTINFADVAKHGAAQLVAAFREVCLATRTVIARSFSPAGWDFINRAEIDGQVDFLSWIQYYDPAVTKAIGPETIDAAGFYAIERLDNGGRVLITGPTYDAPFPNAVAGELVRRLGITPRRLMSRSLDGKGEMEIRWY